MTDQTPEPVRREDGTEAAPSEAIGPDTLDQALLVVVIRLDGSAVTYVSSAVDRTAVAEWLHRTADEVLNIDCEACREGHDHGHEQA